jgi:titin
VDIIDGQLYVLDGAGELSVTVFDIVGGAAAPLPPSTLEATAGIGQIDLSWTDNAGNEAGFDVERCPGSVATTCGGDTGFAVIATVGANVTARADTFPRDGETYTYRVRAFNTQGYSSYSNRATTTAGPAAPPSGLMATATSGSRIELGWTDNADNESGFLIERCLGPAASCGDAAFAELATVGAGVTTYVDAGLAGRTTYAYRVRAFNNAGASAAAGPAEATTLAPENLLMNGGFEADADGNGRPDGWSANASFTRSSEVVRSGLSAGRHLAPRNRNYTILQRVGVSPGTAYSFSGCANIPPSADTFNFRFHLRWLDAGDRIVAQQTLRSYTAPTDGAWDCVLAGALMAPAGAIQAEVRMLVKSLGLTIYVDDLMFEAE